VELVRAGVCQRKAAQTLQVNPRHYCSRKDPGFGGIVAMDLFVVPRIVSPA
jgi:hypothetical protein